MPIRGLIGRLKQLLDKDIKGVFGGFKFKTAKWRESRFFAERKGDSEIAVASVKVPIYIRRYKEPFLLAASVLLRRLYLGAERALSRILQKRRTNHRRSCRRN